MLVSPNMEKILKCWWEEMSMTDVYYSQGVVNAAAPSSKFFTRRVMPSAGACVILSESSQ